MLKAIAFFFILLVPGHALAEIPCNTDVDIPVNIHPIFDTPRYDFTASLEDIQAMVTDTKHSIHETMTLGVTHYEPMVEFHTPVQIITSSDGTTCTHVQKADVTIGYRDVVVYIAREIPQGSCGFNEVMAHEQKHINVNWQMLLEYAPRIQQRLDDYLTTFGAFREEKNDGQMAELQTDLQAQLNTWGQDMMEENVVRQKQIDTDAEYERLSKVCNGQLALIAGRALNKN